MRHTTQLRGSPSSSGFCLTLVVLTHSRGSDSHAGPAVHLALDLERHTVIDVLDQHSTETVEQWLVAHPDIQMICRDRNGRYAKAARTAAPTARQTTDRFHLVQNFRETIERELALHRAYLRVQVTPDGLPADPQPIPALEPPV